MDDFYQAFENKFRGDRQIIKDRLRVYLPFVESLEKLYLDGSAIDLGCGRGEWLELLSENSGLALSGVDVSEAMLSIAREHALPVELQDALACLGILPDESQSMVSGFHIAEHLPFSDLMVLVGEAYRVLQPGGLLILETPNPENIIVGTVGFYMDPTHHQPLPPDLLSFMATYAGFYRSKIMRLQEPYDLNRHGVVTLLNVLDGVSPDYAVIAQKSAQPPLLAGFDSTFEKDYGLTLPDLANKYSLQQADWMARTEGNHQELKDSHQALKDSHQHLQRDYQASHQQLSHQLQEGRIELEARLQKIEIETAAALAREADLLSSKSWRYTRFLRVFVNFFRRGER